MGVELVREPQASGLLEDDDFGHAWAELFAACPWAGTFQDPRFVRIWYRHYRHAFELVGLQSRSASRLDGLLLVARPRTGGDLVAAGSHHAEYQSWLARNREAGERFIVEALVTLRRAFPRGRLRLGFLLPGVPLGWLGRPPWSRLVDVQVEPGAWVNTDAKELTGRLARRKLRKLQSLGEPVEVEVLTDAGRLERNLQQFQDLCDFRQAAINDVRPFREDPHKGPFHTDLLRHAPDLMHVSRLIAGGRVLSAQLNMRHRGDVLVCVQGHLPQAARYSPGFCHMILLARRLADEGVGSLDLSPGGGYKQRNATRTEPAHTLRIDLSRWAADARRARKAAVRTLRGIARNNLRNPTAFEERIRTVHRYLSTGTGGAARSMQAIAKSVRERTSVTIFALDGRSARRLANGPIRLDELDDLLMYDPRPRASRLAFCQSAADRLAYEHHVYTAREGTSLESWAWAARGPTTVRLEPFGPPLLVPDGEVLFYDTRGPLKPACVAAWARHAVDPDVTRVLWAMIDENRAGQKVLESLGFQTAFAWVTERILKRTRYTGDIPARYVSF